MASTWQVPMDWIFIARGDGTVVMAQVNRHGYGKEVVVDHGFGYTSRYAHLQEILVKAGTKIEAG